MSDQTIQFSLDENIATIKLNRPKKYNSFTVDMHSEMKSALRQIRQNKDIRCLIITGNGKGFCTGQDLNDRYELVKSDDINLGQSLEKTYNLLVKTITNLSIPVICAVNGVVAGAGVSLALACDIVIAATSANFIFSFTKVGLIPDAGCSWALVQALGLPRAKALTLLGESISAKQAEDFGLIWKSVSLDTLDAEVNQIANQLLQNPALGLKHTKLLLNSSTKNSLEEQMKLEAQNQTVLGRSADYAEAVCAFVEKRTPNFKNQ